MKAPNFEIKLLQGEQQRCGSPVSSSQVAGGGMLPPDQDQTFRDPYDGHHDARQRVSSGGLLAEDLPFAAISEYVSSETPPSAIVAAIPASS